MSRCADISQLARISLVEIFKFILLFSQAGADLGFVGPEAYTVFGGRL